MAGFIVPDLSFFFQSSMNSIPMQGKLLEAKLEFETEPLKTFRKNNIIVGRKRIDNILINTEDDILRNRKDDIVRNREDDILRPYIVEDSIISKGRRENEITVDVSGNDLKQRTLAQEVIFIDFDPSHFIFT